MHYVYLDFLLYSPQFGNMTIETNKNTLLIHPQKTNTNKFAINRANKEMNKILRQDL